MTPNRRLDQIEPVLSDVVQKVDRLIDTNGQILDLVTKGETTGNITANGLASLTLKVNQIATEQAELRQEVQQGFEVMNQRFDQLITLIQERLK